MYIEPRINMERLMAKVSAIGCLQDAGDLHKAQEVYVSLAHEIYENVGLQPLTIEENNESNS